MRKLLKLLAFVLLPIACTHNDDPVMLNKPYMVFENVVLHNKRPQMSYEYNLKFEVFDSEPFAIYIDGVLRLQTDFSGSKFMMDITSLSIGSHTITYKTEHYSKTVGFDVIVYHQDEPGTYTLPLYGPTY